MKTIILNHEEHAALVAAIMSGALHARCEQLRALIQHNSGNAGDQVADFHEQEMKHLLEAARIIAHG